MSLALESVRLAYQIGAPGCFIQQYAARSTRAINHFLGLAYNQVGVLIYMLSTGTEIVCYKFNIISYILLIYNAAKKMTKIIDLIHDV
jgi:hypothetical protein